MKKIVLLIVVLISFSNAQQVVLSRSGAIPEGTSQITNNFTNGGSDTVVWVRESGVIRADFALSFIDSANVKNIVLKRLINSVVVSIPTLAVADTIAGAAVAGVVPYGSDTVATTAGVAKSFIHSLTLTPYCTKYWFIVKYNNTATQATYKNGDTTLVQYTLHKQYSK